MSEKSWKDMSVDEKLDDLRTLVQDFIARYDRNVLLMDARMFGLEKSVERMLKSIASLPGDSL